MNPNNSTILIVDDEVVMHDILGGLLKDPNRKLAFASNGARHWPRQPT